MDMLAFLGGNVLCLIGNLTLIGSVLCFSFFCPNYDKNGNVASFSFAHDLDFDEEISFAFSSI